MMRLSRWLRIFVPLALASTGCSADVSQASEFVSPRPMTHYVLIVDRSTSIRPAEAEGYQRMFAGVIDSLSFGDRVTLLVANESGRRDGTIFATQEMPRATNHSEPTEAESDALIAAQRSIETTAAQRVFAATPTDYTDLLTSMRTAAEQLSATKAYRGVLMVLSDMLHCVEGEICMDNSGFAGVPDSWFPQAREDSALPSFADVCVSVIGAEAANRRDRHVREFWTRYFEETGGSLVRYTYSPIWSAEEACATATN
jgi:hypothetical protein